jgi:peptidoglycan/xylan/chitin deacetylase (PgdA/CDA1 family)
MPMPDYYSSLEAFEEVFLTGQPVLTYHHVGPRPRGVRLKGLYVGTRLFKRQMAELRSAGFSTPGYSSVTGNGANAQRNVYLTFDDGFVDVLKNAFPVLRDYHFAGIQFLVSGLLGKTNEWQQRQGDVVEPLMDEAQVRDWLAGGQSIGSHTMSHPRLTQLPLADAREEIEASKKALEDKFGVAIEHFCYPYGDWNEAVRDLTIEAGYKTACTTDAGINNGTGSAFSLKRFTARYPSRKLKNIFAMLFPRRRGS